MARLLFTGRAEDDLFSLWHYIAADNPKAADALLDTIEVKCALLAHNPYLGRARPDIALEFRHFPVKNYLILYRIIEKGVEIVRVIHGARDLHALD